MRRSKRLPMSLICACALSCLLVASTRFGAIQRSIELNVEEPITVVSADVDGDGHADLIAGYADSDGARLAVFHNRGDSSNVLPQLSRLDLPVRPDFIAA